MMAGRPPFQAHGVMGVLNSICHSAHWPIREVNHTVPLEISNPVDRLLTKDPSDRISSAARVGEE